DVGLGPVRQVAVGRVAERVSQSEDVVQVGFVVHEDKGVDAVGADGVGAAALALVLQHVYPPVVQALPHDAHVFVAQGTQAREHHLPRLLIGDVQVGSGHQGNIQVVDVQLLHAQEAFPQ